MSNFGFTAFLAFVLFCPWHPDRLGTAFSALSSPPGAPQKQTIADTTGTVIDLPVEELIRIYPEDLRGAKFNPNQDELGTILMKVGERVGVYFRDFQDTASRESVHLARLNAKGKTEASLQKNFDYLIMVYPDQPGLQFEEDRREIRGQVGRDAKLSGFCLTSGYAGTTILFHPQRQSSCMFRYLGRQSAASQAHIIAFAQKPGIENAIGRFRTDGRSKSVPMLYQGFLWVDPRTCQIVRLRADLLAPIPEISLSGHTTEITFSEVRFDPMPRPIWLPQKVTVTSHWKGKTYRNHHLYSDYRLFTVKSHSRIEQPKSRN